MHPDNFVNLATLLLFLVSVVTIYSLESSLSCDFEDQNICGYTQDTSDDFNWTRFSGPTSSFDTGPENDHTFSSSVGHYMYIEASYPKHNETARLISPVYQPPPQPQCLEFWYHMHGIDIGTLRVYFQQDGHRGSPKFTVEGNKGNTWLFGQIEIPAQSPPFQVIFEGVNGNNYRGDIGIDDIEVKPGSCATISAGPDDVVLTPKMLTYSTKEGSDVPDVKCSCSGCVPDCNVIWSFNGLGVGNTSALQLSAVTRFSSGRYTCACVNPTTMYMRTVSFDLDVKYGPIKVVLSPVTTNYTLVEGRSMPDIDCSCGLCSPSCHAYWLYGNSSVGNHSTLQLHNVSREMAGEYSCRCVNPDTHEEKMSDVKIFVEYGPDQTKLTPANRSYVVIEQHRSRLDVLCSCGDCVPSCSSKWLLNGTTKNNDRSLLLENISRKDAGMYTCMCTNINTRKTETNYFNLTVLYGPDYSFPTPNKTIYSRAVGSHLENIDCSCGECHPSCTVKWTKLRKVISNGSALELGRLSLLDSGEYECTCSNTETKKEKTSGFQLTVHALPDVGPCPESTDDWGTTWNKTLAGDVITTDCTRDGYTGTISRVCSRNGQWELPMYDCVRAAIARLENKLQEISKNISKAELSSILDGLVNITKAKDNDVGSMYPRELESVTNALDVVAKLADSGHPLTEDQSRSFVNTASNLLNKENENSWKSFSKSKAQDGASKLLQSVDTLSGAVAKGMNGSNATSVRIHQQNIVLEASKVSENQEHIIFPVPSSIPDLTPVSGAKLSLPLIHSADYGPKTYTVVLYKGLSGILPNTVTLNQSTESKNNLELNTAVLSLQVFPEQETLAKPLEITFGRLNVHYRHGVCSYWNFKMTRWETDGCRMKRSTGSSVVCECNHLTNFAVLMSPWQEPSTDSAVIEVISIIGCSVSIICLIATAALHILLWRNVKNDRAVILLNISIALIATYVIFLAGINRTADQATCKAVAALLHYTLLVVFCLMLAEGVEITISVKYVFLTKSRIKWMLPLSWGIPAVIVGISMGISRLNGYGTEHFCWLSVETGVIWAFVGPAMVIIVVNLAFLGVLLRTMLKTRTYIEMTEIERIKSSVRCLCVLVPLMGGTWVLGIFYVNEGSQWIQYVFAICNSLQGFFIFLFHGLLNKQVHTAIKSRHKKYKDSHSVGKGSHSLSKSPSMKRTEITDTYSLSKSPSTKRTNVSRAYSLNKSRSTKRTNTIDAHFLKKSNSTKMTENGGSHSLKESPNTERTEFTGIMNPAYIPTVVPDNTVQDGAEETVADTLPFSSLEPLEEEPDQMINNESNGRRRSRPFKQCPGNYSQM